MKVIISNQGLTELRISSEGKLVLVSPTEVDTTDYVWEEITRLYCNNNQLETLPPLPRGLKWFYCNHNRLRTLPSLPEGLVWLRCDNNQLRSLPSLPEGLKGMYCSHNKLETLPWLLKGLEWLYCDNNQLRSLPPLPEGLKGMVCRENPLDKGVCRDQVPFKLRGKVPEHAYNLYDEILTLRKGKFREVLGGLSATPF